jgi:hypothetical protein
LRRDAEGAQGRRWAAAMMTFLCLHAWPILIVAAFVLVPILAIILWKDKKATDHPLMCQICFMNEPVHIYKGLPLCEGCFTSSTETDDPKRL